MKVWMDGGVCERERERDGWVEKYDIQKEEN